MYGSIPQLRVLESSVVVQSSNNFVVDKNQETQKSFRSHLISELAGQDLFSPNIFLAKRLNAPAISVFNGRQVFQLKGNFGFVKKNTRFM